MPDSCSCCCSGRGGADCWCNNGGHDGGAGCCYRCCGCSFSTVLNSCLCASCATASACGDDSGGSGGAGGGDAINSLTCRSCSTLPNCCRCSPAPPHLRGPMTSAALVAAMPPVPPPAQGAPPSDPALSPGAHLPPIQTVDPHGRLSALAAAAAWTLPRISRLTHARTKRPR